MITPLIVPDIYPPPAPPPIIDWPSIPFGD